MNKEIKIVTFSDQHWRSISRHQEYTRAFKIFFEELKEIKPDLIHNGGDFYHNKTSQLSSEAIDKMSWAFSELATIAPVYSTLGNHDCFTNGHELLTKTGWKPIELVVKEEKDDVATFNSSTQEIEFQKPYAWISKHVDEEILHITGNEIDAKVTKGHEFLYSFPGHKNYSGKFLKCRADEIKLNANIPTNGVLNKNCNENNISNFYAALLGFAFADATFVLKNEKSGACRIQFKLKKVRKIDFLKTLLEKMGYETNFRSQKDGSTVICIYEKLARKIYQFFEGKKEIPNNIFENDNAFLHSFMTGYLNGDGSNKGNKCYTFCSISKQSRDILVTIGRLIGCSSHSNESIIFGNYANSKQQYQGTCNKVNKVNFTKISSIKKEHYTGDVHCVSVTNGNLLVRNNNKIYVAGNCNLTNLNRSNIIKTIHSLLNNKNLILLEKSNTHLVDIKGKKIAFHPYSLIDKENWNNIKVDPTADFNIALFHGAVKGCKTDLNWTFPHGEVDIEFFRKYDFAFLGDIHKQQYLDYRFDKNNVSKPWIAYNGSLIQQGHGELIKKGYLLWTLREKDDWDVEFKKLVNLQPFVTLNWEGTIEKTLKAFEDLHGKYAYLPGTRYRICSNVHIPQLLTKQLVDILKVQKKGEEVTFKTDIITNIDSIETHGVKINKRSLTSDPEIITKLYNKFIESNKESYDFVEEDLLDARNIIKEYYAKLQARNVDMFEPVRNVQWSIKELKFDNIFIYGEDNYVNFDKLNNIVGIFGNNAVGKSTVIASLVYTLFNGTDRGSIKNALLINRNKKECFGSVRFSVGGTDYLVERRTIKSSKHDDEKSNTNVNLWLIENRDGQEVKVSKNGITRDDTDKIIRSLIGTPEDFLLTALASQHDLHRFIDNKATKRKEILNRFLELDLFDRLYEYAKADYTLLDNQSKNYSTKNWFKLIEQTQKEIEKLEKELTILEDKFNSTNDKKDSLNLWLKTHENKANLANVAAISNIQKVISKLELDIEKHDHELDKYEKNLKQKKSFIDSLEKETSKVNIEELKEEEKSLEDLKTTVNNIQKSYDTQNVVLNTQQKAVTKLKVVPCGDSFPNCHYIKDAHEASKNIEQQTSLVKELQKSLKENQKLLEKYISKKISEKIIEYNDKKISLMMHKTEHTNLIDKIEHKKELLSSLKKELKTSTNELKNLTSSIDMLGSEEFKNKKEQYNKIVSDITDINKRKNESLISIGGKRDYLKNLQKEQTQGKDVLKKLKMYESIQTAFSKTGIPVMVLKEQLPAINEELAKILDGLVDFKITLETDTSSNTMDIYLEDLNKRPIELCSGMEKTICSLAIRVALGNLSSLPRPDIFILDESFGALDEENLQKSMELLQMFRDYFKTVLLISHINEIKEIADHIIEIKNDGKESKIEA